MSREGEPDRVETLLTRLFAPVEPPAELTGRLHDRLESISQLAADELDGWELAAMRDPRNWARPVVALAAASAAGVGLVLLGRHQRQRIRRTSG